ncbi:glycosyltransferase [Clostridium perfringens]|uniref:glycosyltransferase n=1 Tax=Clostridium perfringens TaxID=1502 RepID=UPI0018E43FDA|nr:glycosyltransferase [Clostridium perfringens]MBI6022003.1 glycosyltransferase [Clostridium perfringens]MDH2340214.1 glycosyltransferase [Clostridium perfringens]HDI3014528.1 glycosyltransferase [Clostridium perfringens]
MKILINAISAKKGGAKVIVNSFINNMPDDNNEYHFLVNSGVLKNDSYKLKENIFIHENNIGSEGKFKRLWWDQVILPQYIKKNKFEYMINLSNYGPMFPNCKQILLLHNAKHISKEIKSSYTFKEKIELFVQDCILRVSLLGVYKLVVQTNYMKEGVVNKFRFNSNKIFIIPNAPNEILSEQIDYNLEKKLEDFINCESNILSDITLYGKHKNLELLLYSIKYIKDNRLGKVKLILTIDPTKGNDNKRLIDMIRELGIEEYVYSVGLVKHENIHQILNRSKIFVFPSYAESFGLPFVEAMKFGLPIVAADLGFAHDVCGNAALYFKYNNSKELAIKIIEIFSNENLMNEMSNESLKQGSKYQEGEIVKKYISLLS